MLKSESLARSVKSHKNCLLSHSGKATFKKS